MHRYAIAYTWRLYQCVFSPSIVEGIQVKTIHTLNAKVCECVCVKGPQDQDLFSACVGDLVMESHEFEMLLG